MKIIMIKYQFGKKAIVNPELHVRIAYSAT